MGLLETIAPYFFKGIFGSFGRKRTNVSVLLLAFEVRSKHTCPPHDKQDREGSLPKLDVNAEYVAQQDNAAENNEDYAPKPTFHIDIPF